MFRIAVIAYLSLATVLGPSLCCCNAGQLFSGVTRCKGDDLPSRSAKAKSSRHHHEHCQGHAHGQQKHKLAHQHGSTCTNKHSSQNPCDHENQGCPCGNRQAKLVAISPVEGSHSQVVSMQAQLLSALAFVVAVVPELDLREVTTTAHIHPNDLFGREMLRAYKTLRC